jgi:osmotically-inducible protein OsmY
MSSTTMIRSDEQIQRDVLDELTWDARVQPNEIGVAVKDGIVALTGWVDSFAKKWVAERAAHRVHGVMAVVNDIEVRLPGSAERSDEDIAVAATRALEWDTLVPTENVELTVSKGTVTLRGEVEWEFERQEAERAVRRLSGVRGVINAITVRPRVTASPQQLQQKIENALVRNAETDAQRITIDVDGSKVTLRGTVRSWMEKREAERIAWSSPGVTSVDNRIQIEF